MVVNPQLGVSYFCMESGFHKNDKILQTPATLVGPLPTQALGQSHHVVGRSHLERWNSFPPHQRLLEFGSELSPQNSPSLNQEVFTERKDTPPISATPRQRFLIPNQPATLVTKRQLTTQQTYTKSDHTVASPSTQQATQTKYKLTPSCRPTLSRHHSLIQPLRQMTVGSAMGTSKPRSEMDIFNELYSSQSLDHMLPADINSLYASSPNSLYMYEQEKVDMESFSDAPGSSMTNLLNDESFELKSQYENSRDIPLSVCTSATVTANVPCTYSDNSWVEGVSKPCDTNTLVKTEDDLPTFAELNSSRSEENTLMDINDISGFVNPENLQQNLDALFSAQQNFQNVDSSHESKSNRGRGRHSSAGDVSKTWTVTSPSTQSTALYSNMNLPNYQRMPLASSSRVRHSSASYPSATVSQVPQKSIIETSAPTLHQLLSQKTTRPVTLSTLEHTVPSTSMTQLSPAKRKTSPIPMDEEDSSSIERKWEDIKYFLYNDEKTSPTQPKQKRASLDSIGSAQSIDDSDSDSDVQDLYDSESEGSQEEWTMGKSNREGSRQSRKESQEWWQYNRQLKGPKGRRVNFEMEKNPHKVQDFEDPVFDSSSASQLGTTIRHGGKARKGDGNDISPSPKKLVQIGGQIKKLNRQINNFAPLSELPVSTRNKSKKEKNKLASRACRLKKKAQHEANKVKLHGLDIEHKQLLGVIDTIRCDLHDFIVKKVPHKNFSSKLEELIKENLTLQVAGNTTEYVNTVIAKVEAGDPTGGLDTRGHT